MIPISKPKFLGNEKKYVNKCLETVWISSQGDFVGKFEAALEEFLDVKHVVCTSNGTTALQLALSGLGISPNDEVIVPNITFGATANAVLAIGAKPVLAEVCARTWNVDADKIEPLLTKNTKAIIPVHLYGNPCNMIAINKIAADHDLFIVEDCAEALGATVGIKKIGTFGNCGTFSFFSNKLITTGEGGAVSTDDTELYHKLLIMRDHGMRPEKRYWHEQPGFNYRMTNMQAAIGCAQMEKIERFIEKRREIHSWYLDILEKDGRFTFQDTESGASSICWLFSSLLANVLNDQEKQKLLETMKIKGFELRDFFYPLDGQPAFADYSYSNYQISSNIHKRGISFPTFFDLKKNDVKNITTNLFKYLELLK